MKTQEDTKPEVITSVRLPFEDHAFLKAYAESQQRTFSGQLRWMIDQLRREQEEAA